MANYEVTLTDRSVQEIDDAHAFQQEGPMTTFFRNEETRQVVDSWSTRVFSVRTSEVLMIRMVPTTAQPVGVAEPFAMALTGTAGGATSGAPRACGRRIGTA